MWQISLINGLKKKIIALEKKLKLIELKFLFVVKQKSHIYEISNRMTNVSRYKVFAGSQVDVSGKGSMLNKG